LRRAPAKVFVVLCDVAEAAGLKMPCVRVLAAPNIGRDAAQRLFGRSPPRSNGSTAP
jgi:hypothetical protein